MADVKYDWWGSVRLGELFVPVQARPANNPRYTLVCSCHHEPFEETLHVCESGRVTPKSTEPANRPTACKALEALQVGNQYVPLGERVEHEVYKKLHRLELQGLIPLDEIPWHTLTGGNYWLSHNTEDKVERDDWVLFTRTLQDEAVAGIGHWYAFKREQLVVVHAFTGGLMLNTIAFGTERAEPGVNSLMPVGIGESMSALLDAELELIEKHGLEDYQEPAPLIEGDPPKHKQLTVTPDDS